MGEKKELLPERIEMLPKRERGKLLGIIDREVTRLMRMENTTDSNISDTSEHSKKVTEERDREGKLSQADGKQDAPHEGEEVEEQRLKVIRRDVTRLLTTDTSYLVNFNPDKKTRAIVNQMRGE